MLSLQDKRSEVAKVKEELALAYEKINDLEKKINDLEKKVRRAFVLCGNGWECAACGIYFYRVDAATVCVCALRF